MENELGNFAHDRAYGSTAETQVQAYLNSNNPRCDYKQAEGLQKAYDLKCEHCKDMVEVKADRLAPTTGNICFEDNLFKHTKSKRVIYVISGIGYMFDVKALLRRLTKLEKKGKVRRLKLGDNNSNPACLVRAEDILEISQQIDLDKSQNWTAHNLKETLYGIS